MKKVLIIGKRGFIGVNLYKYLKKTFFIKKISFKSIKSYKNKFNNFDFIINTSINRSYIKNKYNLKYDNDLKIIQFIKNPKTIYCFISTRKIYSSKANLKENSTINTKSNYSKNKFITEKKIKKLLNKNYLILRVSNVIGDSKSLKRIHKTFMDIFLENVEKGFIFENDGVFKDFLSIEKFCQIIKYIIRKEIVGTYNVSIGQKVYLNDLINWLNKYNKKKIKIKKNSNKTDSFYLNNNKLMSKIKIRNNLLDLKNYCHKFSKKKFLNN